MLDILGITFPVFATIAIGFMLVRGGVFAAADMQVLGKFAVNIGLPATMFLFVASRDISEITQFGYIGIYAASGLATIGVAVIWTALIGAPDHVRAVAPMGASCPNSTFVGFPIILLAFPNVATLALTLQVLTEMLILIPVCLVIMDLFSGRRDAMLRRVLAIIAGILKMPMMIGILAGLVVSVSGISLPGPVDRLVTMLAGSLAAVALVMIGGSIASGSMRGELGYAAMISIGKTVLQPAIAAVIAITLIGTGLITLGADMTSVLIVSAGMPVIGVYPVFAQRAGGQAVAAAVVFISTLMAVVTLNILLWLVT